MKKSEISKFISEVPRKHLELLNGEQKEVECSECKKHKIYINDQLIIDCDCQFKDIVRENKKKQQQKKLDFFFNQSLVPLSIKNASFENAIVEDVATQTAYSLAYKYVTDFDIEKLRNLIIEGGTGTGKSYLSYCIAKALKEKGYTVLFIDIVELLEVIRSTFNNNSKQTEHEYMEVIQKVDLLVLDDVGANKQTDWANQVLYNISNKRAGKHTIYTTNLSYKEMAAESTFELKRSYSRMFENAKVIKMYGKDRRLEGLHE